MGLNSFVKQAYLAPESIYGGTSGTPTRAIKTDVSVTPVVNTADITANASGSKLAVNERVKIGTLSNITFSGSLMFEYLPIFVGMLLGGGSDLVKDILDAVTDSSANAGTAANPTNPDQVAQYLSEVLETQPVLPNHYSLYYDDKTSPQVIRGLLATSLTITLTAGAVATYTLSCVGHYPVDTSVSLANIEVIKTAAPIVVSDQITTVNGTRLVGAVKATTITIPSGLTATGTSDGGFNPNVVVSGKRNPQIQITTNNDTDATAIRAGTVDLTRSEVSIQLIGPGIRTTTPLHNRNATFTMNGQITDSGELYPDDNGEFVNQFTFDSIADSAGNDITADITVQNDDGGLI